MVILEEDLGFAERPPVHFQPHQQETTGVTIGHHALVIGERQEEVSLEELGEGETMREAVLTDTDGLHDAGVAQLLEDLLAVKHAGTAAVVGLDATHELWVAAHLVSRNNCLVNIKGKKRFQQVNIVKNCLVRYFQELWFLNYAFLSAFGELILIRKHLARNYNYETREPLANTSKMEFV